MLQPVPLREFSLEWRLPEYTARASQMHPSATPGSPLLVIEAGAHRPEDGWVSYSGTLFNPAPSPSAPSSPRHEALSRGHPCGQALRAEGAGLPHGGADAPEIIQGLVQKTRAPLRRLRNHQFPDD